MKIIKVSGVGDTQYLVRHWGKWYVIVSGGGLLSTSKWFKEARKI